MCIVQAFRNNQSIHTSLDPLVLSTKSFWLFFVVIFALIAFLPPMVSFFLKKALINFEIKEPNLLVLSVFVSQLLMMFFLCCVKKYFKLPCQEASSKRLVLFGLQKFGCVLPIILFVSVIWVLFLVLLRRLGLNISLNEQEAVVLFSQSSGALFKVLFCVSAVIFAPFIEEYVFRAGIYRALKARIDTKWAAFFASVVFAAMHFNLVSFVPLFIFSQYLIKYYECSGNINVPIVIHGAFNLNSVVLITLSINL